MEKQNHPFIGIRNELGISQAGLSSLLRDRGVLVSVKSISAYECGRRRPRPYIAERISRALGSAVDPMELASFGFER